ncbi:MAG: metal-dependent transcriptional regulator [Planctomycetota bacterium]
MTAAKKLSASLEDYLEAIFQIAAEKKVARSKDISKVTRVSRSSVTGALRALSEKGLINYAPYDLITLTPKGRAVAEGVVRRHEVLREFFVEVLGVDERQGEKAACKMEHAMSGKILERFIRFVDSTRRGGAALRAEGPGGKSKADTRQDEKHTG